MRTTIPALALLLSLASAAAAQSTASATSTVTATYAASSPAVTLTHLTQGFYDLGTPDFDDAGGKTTLTHTGSASGTLSGTTLTTTSTSSVSLNSANYATVRSLAYSDVFQGYRYFLTFTNTSTSAQTLAFTMGINQGTQVAARSPYGRAVYDADLNLGSGAYAYGGSFGGVSDVTDPDNPGTGYENNPSQETANQNPLGTSVPYAGMNAGISFEADYALAAGETRTYEVFASTQSYVQFAPVQAAPEPSSIAAIGLGAIALLRRRKKA